MSGRLLPETRRGRERGFTLVELVIGASVLAGVLLAAYLTLEAGLKSEDLLEWRRDASQGARAALALLAADLRSACRLSEDVEFIGMDREIEGIEADNIDFGTRNWRPEGPGESDFAEASWFVNQDPETKELGLWRRRDPTPDLDPLSGGRTEEVIAPIAGFRLEYYDGFLWQESWGDERGVAAPVSGAPRETAAPSSGSIATSSTGSVSTSSTGGAAATSPIGIAASTSGLPDAVRITIALAPPRRGPTVAEEIRGPEEKQPGTSAPLLFRTTVRLNLAARESSARTSLSANAGQAAAAPTPATTGGR